jgi:GAF domain-containing protein/CheY-like chemotaxis protein
MNPAGPDLIRVLLVNDDDSDLEHYRETIERHCRMTIAVDVFGPKQAGNSEVARRLLELIESRAAAGKTDLGYDVLFVDFLMPDINGLQFLKFLRKRDGIPWTWRNRLPVVLMTKYESQLRAQMDDAVEEGAGGYVFTGRDDLLWIDFEATAKRVYQENQREIWAQGLMKISSQLPGVSGKNELCSLVISSLEKACPSLKVFIREIVPPDSLRLLAVSNNIADEYRSRLAVIRRDLFPTIDTAVRGEIAWYNSLDELQQNGKPPEQLGLLTALGLERGMSFPLKGVDSVFGTVSMYRRRIDPPFTPLERQYAELMIDQVAQTWVSRMHRQQGLAYARFFREFTRCDNEDALCKALVVHLHEGLNCRGGKPDQSKTTYKRLIPSSDRLACGRGKGHHLGAARDESFAPSVYSATSISAFVARENVPVLIKNYIDEPRYQTSNREMQSELCLPVASAADSAEPVFGVLNMENAVPGYYTEQDLEYAEAMCRLAGHYVDRLRTQAFLQEVLGTLGESLDRTELIERSIGLIRKLTGYRLLIFVFGSEKRWKVTNVDTSITGYDVIGLKAELESVLNGPDSRTLIQSAFRQKRDIYYQPDLQQLGPGGFYEPSAILGEGEKLRSQAVFVMRAGGEVIGGLSLDFVITNPLSKDQQLLLEHFAQWLGPLILQTDAVADLRKRVNLLNGMARVADLAAQVWHTAAGELHSLRMLASKCETLATVTGDETLLDYIRQVQLKIEAIYGLPERMKGLAKKPELQCVKLADTWRQTKERMSQKIKNLNIEIVETFEIEYVLADTDIMQMVLFHLLDNALDACADQQTRLITLRARKSTQDAVEISLLDTGCGVCEEDLNSLGSLTMTTKPRGLGYGLFFVTCRMADMGGGVRLRNRTGQRGFEAILTLPASGESAG